MDIKSFLKQIFELTAKLGLNLSDFELDHIAFQAASPEDYDQRAQEFNEQYELAHENIVGGRRVGVWKMSEPITFGNYSTSVIELIEPKDGKIETARLEHAEFYNGKSLEEIKDSYPDLDGDTSSMDRDDFAHLKLKLSEDLQIKFPRVPILNH